MMTDSDVTQTEKELLSEQLQELSQAFRELTGFAGPAAEELVFRCFIRGHCLGITHGQQRVLRRVKNADSN